MPLTDLHAHTRHSDGTNSPSEVVYYYKRAGVRLMSVTDHDTLSANKEAAQKAAQAGMLYVNGVEISTKEHDHLHFLGFNVDPENKILQEFLEFNRSQRNKRVKGIIKQLRDAGVDIEEQDVFGLVKTVASRAHVADALKNKRLVPTRQEAFRKYLVQGKPGYAAPRGASVEETIKIIRQAGGLAFIAHPGIVKDHWNFPAWTNVGLSGIEIYYPAHSFQTRQDLFAIAAKYNLLISAGSDFHGTKSGRCCSPGFDIPQETFDNLKKAFGL